MKYLVILFLFFCEFTFGQLPGSPMIIGKRNFPTVYTLDFEFPTDISTAVITGQVINTGLSPVTVSGILWGYSKPTITSFLGKTVDGNTLGQPFNSYVTLPENNTIFIVAYATTDAGTFYGKVLTIPAQTAKSPHTGKTWMSLNLGAKALPIIPKIDADNDSYGHLYQWGRKTDGHQIILPLTGTTPFSGTYGTRLPNASTSDKRFITGNSNWISSVTDNLWQGLNGVNNPCPAGYRVPTSQEFLNETVNFSSQNFDGAFNSFLVLPVTSSRTTTGALGTAYFNYNSGRYWTSTVSGTQTIVLSFATGLTYPVSDRAVGNAVRCIKGEASSGGSAVVTGYNITSSTGNMIAGVPVSGVSQTISATVSTIGNYDISAITNGVTYSAAGTFTTTGTQNIVLTASGTPLVATANASPYFNTFTLNTIPGGSFTKTVSGETSNGTAEVGSYTPKSSSGEMVAGTTITGGVSQTFTANVTTPGSYNLKAINKGVTFIASGTFTETGDQDIVLTASGTPSDAGVFTFNSNTTPSATFSRSIFSPTTNGTAIVSLYQLATPPNSLKTGVSASENNIWLYATVAQVGTYNISTNDVDGVTFNASGVFTQPMIWNLFLSGSGTPVTISASNTFTTNTNPPFSVNIATIKDNTTNGTGGVEYYTDLGQNGTIFHQVPISNVTRTIRANVTRPGSYFLSATTNGITFSGSGTFSSTGITDIVLTGSGTPTTLNMNTAFILNTGSPATLTFSSPVGHRSSGGTSEITSYISTTPRGNLWLGYNYTGTEVQQTITANFLKVGSYNIKAFANGVTFTGNGSVTSIGNNNIVLTASGTPLNISDGDNFTLNTISPDYTFSRPTVHGSTNGSAIVSSYGRGTSTGFMYPGRQVSNVSQIMTADVTTVGSYNLITPTANGVTFAASGNFTNTGIQYVTLTGTGTPTVKIEATNFILNTNGVAVNNFYRETSHRSTNGQAEVNPYSSISSEGTMIAGVPVSQVYQTIRANVTVSPDYPTFNISATSNGVTFSAIGEFNGTTGLQNILLTASGTPTSAGTYSYALNTTPSVTFTRTTFQPASNGTAVVENYTIGTAIGQMTTGQPVSGVTQTFTANVTTTGTYQIKTNTVNGVTFSGSGSFTSTGNKNFTLTATGTPISEGTYSYTLNTNPGGNFDRIVNHESSGGSARITWSGMSNEALTNEEKTENNRSLEAFNESSTFSPSFKQYFRVNVTKIGSYNIDVMSLNYPDYGQPTPLRLVGAGNFTTTGEQTITLYYFGVPNSLSETTFKLPMNSYWTTNNIEFVKSVNNSSGGSAFISWENNVPATTGVNLTTEQNTENSRNLIYSIESSTYNPPFKWYRVVNVTRIGSYNLNILDGRDGDKLRLVGSGTFTTTGWQTITLNFIGAPFTSGYVNHTFSLPNSGRNVVKYSN